MLINLNGRKGRLHAEVALQTGADKVCDVVVKAEALEDQQRRPIYGTYDLVWNSKYISVYIRKDREIKVVGRDWALIGGNIPSSTEGSLQAMAIADGGSKKRVLGEWIEAEEMRDIGQEEHTHVWGRNKCRICRVLTRGAGRTWWIKDGSEGDSDRMIILAKVDIERYKTSDQLGCSQEMVEEEEEERADQPRECKYIGSAYETLKETIDNQQARTDDITGRSKRWWKRD